MYGVSTTANSNCPENFLDSSLNRGAPPLPENVPPPMPFCNLTPYKSTTEKDQVNLGLHKFKFSNWYFGVKQCVVLNQFDLGIQQMSFFLCEV